MRISTTTCRLALLVAVAGLICQRGAAQHAEKAAAHAEDGSAAAALAQFQSGYYLQTLKKDPLSAAKAYEQVLANASAPAALRNDAQQRLAECREDIAASDPAKLLPGNAIAYVEVNRPGEHVGTLLNTLGLVGARAVVVHESKPAITIDPTQPPAPKGADHAAIPLDGPFVLPRDFAISPALVRELSKVRSIAVAITSISRDGIPDGVMVVHPGESDLVRGLAETGIQFVAPGEAIAGFKTYQIENQVWIVQTARLFLVGGSKSQVAAAVARLGGKQGDSLAAQKPFAALNADRQGALLFAYVAGDQIASLVMSHAGLTEAMVARSVADLDHLESISAAARVSDAGVAVQVKTVMSAGHKNLAYALLRTAPATRRTLAHVPSGIAALGILGLNPASEPAPIAEGKGEPKYVTAMDLGREVFANIEEISVFVMPNAKTDLKMPMPEVGLVFGVKDPQQSEALWDQLLSLPSMFGAPLTSPPKEVTIDGVAAREFQFPFIPPIVLVAQKDRTFLAGTHGAVSAALAVGAGKADAVAKDVALQPLVDALPKNTSKAVIANVGRAVRMTMPLTGEKMKPELIAATSALDRLTLSAVTDEQPTEFAVRVAATGLPNVMELARLASEFENHERRLYTQRVREAQSKFEAAQRHAHEEIERLDGKTAPIDVSAREDLKRIEAQSREALKGLQGQVEEIRRQEQPIKPQGIQRPAPAESKDPAPPAAAAVAP